jgi:hypothetical protein
MLSAFAATLLLGAPEMRMVDVFDRDVTERVVTLLDWEGQIANPVVRLAVRLPEGLAYPATVYLHGTSSRLHFDRSNPEDRTGIGKRVDLPTEPKDRKVEFLASMFPDRDGADEELELVTQLFAGGKELSRMTTKMRVVDQDKPGTRGSYPIHLDFSEDRTGWV